MSANGLILKRCVCAAALIAASGRVAAQDVPSAPGLHRDVVFSEYAAPSENREILRRMLTPLAFAQMEKVVARSGKSLQTQPLDLKDERFTVYVPATPPPPAGYGLLVFVPPWDDARLPDGWSSILDARGIVFVTAAQSGNEQGVVNRRAPLALLAEENTVRRYRIDPARIYVGGFSGGSRVAMRLALAYPDIFTGASGKTGSHGAAEWAVAWTVDTDGSLSSYCNTIPTPDGGTHESGLRSALLRGLKDHAQRTGQEKRA